MGDAHTVRAGQERARVGADDSGRNREHVLSERDVDRREHRRQAVADHGARTVGRFLGRLEQRDQGAVPVVAPLGEQLGGPEQRGDVDVVPAPLQADGPGVPPPTDAETPRRCAAASRCEAIEPLGSD